MSKNEFYTNARIEKNIEYWNEYYANFIKRTIEKYD